MFFKEEVVDMMTDYINKMNREGLIQMGAIESDINAAIEKMEPELRRVNGELYDMLKTNGVIH